LNHTGVIYTKAEQAEEIFLHQNKIMTKHEVESRLGKPVFNENLAVMPSEHPSYARKKRALKNAIFKSKMGFMQDMIKNCTLRAFGEL